MAVRGFAGLRLMRVSMCVFMAGCILVQANKEAKQSIATLKSMVAKIIRQRRSDMGEHGAGEAGPAQDLLSLLIAAHDDEAGKLSDQELRVRGAPRLLCGRCVGNHSRQRPCEPQDLAMTFIMAGHETTAQLMSWSLVMLNKHPEWIAKCVRVTPPARLFGGGAHASVGRMRRQAARRDRLGAAGSPHARVQRSGPPPSRQCCVARDAAVPPSRRQRCAGVHQGAWLAQLRQLQCLCRTAGPVAGLTRVVCPAVLQDVSIGKYTIKKGTMVRVSPYSIHHSPLFWDAPEEWRPERFASGTRDVIKHKLAFIPFRCAARGWCGCYSSPRVSRPS